MTFEAWLEENNGMPVDMREVAERLVNDNPTGAADLVRLAREYLSLDILFYQELEEQGYEFG